MEEYTKWLVMLMSEVLGKVLLFFGGVGLVVVFVLGLPFLVFLSKGGFRDL